MKVKIATMLIFILLVVVDVSAQTKIGIRTGINFGNLNDRNESAFNPTTGAAIIYGETEIRTGFVAGAFLEQSILEKLSLRIGLNFIQKGNTRYAKEGEIDIVNEIEINNIDCSLLVKYRININEKLSAFAMAGPYLGYLLSAKTKSCRDDLCKTNGLLFIPEYDDYDDLEMHRGDIGMSVGAGILFKKHLFIDFRYVTGSRNIWRHRMKTTTKGFQIGVGCFF